MCNCKYNICDKRSIIKRLIETSEKKLIHSKLSA